MNAYRNYKKSQGLAKARAILDDNMDRYIEHVELLFLYIMNAEFKHKPKDLYKFVEVFHEYLIHFRKRFVLGGDDTRLYGKEKRMDVFALLYNHGTEPFAVDGGMKISQLVVIPCMIDELKVVEGLPKTNRGANGFGSTGA